MRAGADPRRCRCTWYADLTVAGRRRYWPLGPDLAAARREHHRLVSDARRSALPPAPRPRRQAGFTAVSERWWSQKEPRIAPNTASGYRVSLAHAQGAFGDGDVRAISAPVLGRMEAALLRAGLRASTVRQVRTVTRQVLRHARAEGLIADLPDFDDRLPSSGYEPHVIAPPDMRRVLGLLGEPYGRLTRFTWLTGLRAGEAIAVEAGDLEGAVLHVRRSRIQRTGELGPTKSRRNRAVDLSAQALSCLQGSPETGPLFPASYTVWLRAWHDALVEAGLERCGLHTLRHSNAALRLVAGQTPAYVARQLGHANSGFTLRVYGRWMPSHRDDSRLLDAASHGA